MIDIVPAWRARELITRELDPLVAEMASVREGVWAKTITDEIRAIIRIRPMKGAQYDITYGVCCAWVPKSAGSNRFGRFPRTVKQATLHLWVDHFTVDALPREWVSTLDGENVVQRQSAALARDVMDRAPAWWCSVDSPDGVLAEARRQAQNRFDVHCPRARVVAAFTLARLSDLEAARAELTLDGDDDNLRSLLEKVPIAGRSASGWDRLGWT